MRAEIVAFQRHRAHAKYRGIPFLLTFDAWWGVWEASGKWQQRGCHNGQYCMARFGDKGGYEVGNVRICLVEENQTERNANYPQEGELNPAYGKDYWASASDEERARRAVKVSKQFKSKPKSAEQREKMRQTALLRRCVVRNGRRTWSHPGDADYPRIDEGQDMWQRSPRSSF